MEEARNMTQTLHIVLQGKGGVGKSVVSRLLQEYMIAKGIDYIGFDADPVNQTFAAHENDKVTSVNLLAESGGAIDSILFDSLLEKIVTSKGKSVILDTGASTFLPFMEYLTDSDIVAILESEGFEVFIHTLVTGGTSTKDTIEGFVQLAERFGKECNVVVWENEHFGKVSLEGKTFMDIISVKKSFKNYEGIHHVFLKKQKTLHEAAILDFLEQGASFDEASAKTNTTFQMMARHRLAQLKAEYVSLLDPVIGDQENAA